jgi:RNA polymerase sigma factor (sigma-70 family)
VAAVPSLGRANGIERAGVPEAEATRALYERYANQIFRYCLHQLGSREEAEDAVQSTFLNAFRGIKRGVVPELESAWLFKIAHNVCLSRRRSSWRRGRIESPTDFELVEEVTPAHSQRPDELIGLQDVLEEMPESQRRAILLREWQGLSYREIAAELELSQAAVETLIFRARRTLATGLEQSPLPRRRRATRALDLGGLLAGLKSLLLGGTTAAKIAAVAAVGATTVVAAEPVVKHYTNHPPAPSRTVPRAPAAKAPAAPQRTPPVVVPVRAVPVQAANAGASARAERRAVTRKGQVRAAVRAHAKAPVEKAAPVVAHVAEPSARAKGGDRAAQAKQQQNASPQKSATKSGAKSGARRPTAPTSAAASPKGTVSVPAPPAGDETNAVDTPKQGSKQAHPTKKRGVAVTVASPADAAPAGADSGGNRGRQLGAQSTDG